MFRKRGTKVVAAITAALTPTIGLLNSFDVLHWSQGNLEAVMIGVPAIGLGIIGVISAILGEPDDAVGE